MASKHGLKRMKTTAERRADAQGIKPRAARNPANLPNAYDDKPTARQPRPDRYKNHRRARILDTVDVA